MAGHHSPPVGWCPPRSTALSILRRGMTPDPEHASSHPPAPAPPAPYRLIALDVDGTLLNPAGHVSPRTRAAVREALARGVAVVICTGRVFSQGIRHLSEELG